MAFCLDYHFKDHISAVVELKLSLGNPSNASHSRSGTHPKNQQAQSEMITKIINKKIEYQFFKSIYSNLMLTFKNAAKNLMKSIFRK